MVIGGGGPTYKLLFHFSCRGLKMSPETWPQVTGSVLGFPSSHILQSLLFLGQMAMHILPGADTHVCCGSQDACHRSHGGSLPLLCQQHHAVLPLLPPRYL